MSDTYFYCQSCNHKIAIDQLALLDAGKCPECSSLEGFSTVSKEENDGFETLTVINDAQLLEKAFEKENGGS